ncbi:MAG: manganese efflux pump [Eubacterium sp.]|nr:manganese efflux pump [Eubacterium sp.]
MILILLLSLSVSIDSFGIGAAYGMEKITIPRNTKWMITGINGVITLAAVTFGQLLTRWMDPVLVQCFGGVILIALGIRGIFAGKKQPSEYDKDHSRILEPGEGMAVGISLAADAACGAVCLCNMGWEKYLFPILTMFFGTFFLLAGASALGKKQAWQKAFPVDMLASAVLIALGAFRIFFSRQ